MLDLVSVRLFILAVEFGNLTRAAEAAGTVQPVVSTRLKALEAALGRKLLDRTPRFVRPTEDGVAFLAKARALMAAHDSAACFDDAPTMRFAIGASDHALGTGLEHVIRHVRAALPSRSALELRSGTSLQVRAAFDDGDLDAVIVRREAGGAEGEVLGLDPLGWRCGDDDALAQDRAVPLITLGPACGVRAVAVRRLDAANRPWREAFIGGSCSALLAAVRAGLGVAPMGAVASGRMGDVGPRLGLPDLPPSEIVMLARTGSPTAAAAARALDAAVRTLLREA
ncbi:LuxR family transcriptional regulator [Methylobacterium sp. Leaf469]|uniref:LysR family transcriptional regulator n=1 Tax=unclassified Methylobacterium TaxID=2615210 RepID=UPI0006F90EF9|nr:MULTISPECIES: LysR family transcriptional regulator [unclassified Methylobacterium]KQP28316.1 LuxR family transcriptional regulator [Methylobacterium sp. Leaf102]KQP34811.1 LuxR family transcriptional regulator [Methylobacterium sp. Leaf100]KQT89904.1 LuxR family transcriptional regulator [Methylobacterium sp. Leaf469]USU34131.1 LysR family transcriptional regulator [Methylobacterium sp. OTU13CASTA1]